MNHAQTIIENFNQLIERQSISGDKNASFRIRTYKNIIKDIQESFSDTPIDDIHVFEGRKGYGKSSLARIQEIINTGTLCELSNTLPEQTEHEKQIQELIQIIGIGPVKAKKIVALGGTLSSLKDAYDKQHLDVLKPFQLTQSQLLGFKYIEDMKKRIPQFAIQAFEADMLNITGQHYDASVCGSYRRGQDDSGDIDVLITSSLWQNDTHAKQGLKHFLEQLCKADYLVDHMTEPKKVKTKYMGFIKLPSLDYVCRIDIRSVIPQQYPFALAYFTGSKEENLRLRNSAKKQGFKLSEYKLERLDDSTQHILIQTEEELYTVLNESFVPPTQR